MVIARQMLQAIIASVARDVGFDWEATDIAFLLNVVLVTDPFRQFSGFVAKRPQATGM
jgi:hypothetical protein